MSENPDVLTAIIKCPVDDCSWSIDATAPTIPPSALASVFGLGVMTAVSAAENAGRVESSLKAHLSGHPVIDFVQTIVRLRKENARATQVAAPPAGLRSALEQAGVEIKRDRPANDPPGVQRRNAF